MSDDVLSRNDVEDLLKALDTTGGPPAPPPPDKKKAAQSTVKRADVKKETAAANKAGTLPHGEIEGKPTKP